MEISAKVKATDKTEILTRYAVSAPYTTPTFYTFSGCVNL